MLLFTVSVSTRTCNTSLPDSTWSDWSAPLHESPDKITSSRARFIQVRAQLARRSDPRLQSVSVYYQLQNQKPEISSVFVGDKTGSPPEKNKVSPPKTDSDSSLALRDLASTVASALQQQSTEAKTEELRPKPPSPIKKISWRADDKDGDALVYRLYFQGEGDSVWVPVSLEKPLKTTEYSWNMESIPDGWYRIKVIASDEDANPAGDSLTDEKVSERFKVDNTRPDVLALHRRPRHRRRG